jgi:hypothetical protein
VIPIEIITPTLKQFCYFNLIKDEIGEEKIQKRCYCKFNKKFGRLLPEQAEQIIRYFYFKYSLPGILWVRDISN